jgi:MFS family permease
VLIAVGGTGVVFIFAAVTYAILIILLIGINVKVRESGDRDPFFQSLAEGVRYVRRRPLIWSLMGLDLSQTLFAAYRVLLPAYALDVLNAGPAGYGLLAAAPSLGALVGTPIIYRLAQRRGSGRIILLSTMGFGVTCVLFAVSPVFALSLVIALGLGFFDALAATIRMSAVQLETPDELRGRVTSLYQLTGRGGPALGDANVGLIASLVGPVIALSAGALVPIIAAAAVWRWSSTVRDYEATIDDPDEKDDKTAP